MDAFNTLTTDPFLAEVPAILLAGSRHADLASTARCDGRRRIVQMPVQAEELTRLLDDLVGTRG